jgi:branched-subunit amino acid transport protein
MSEGQSRQASFLEALTNVVAGYGVALLVQAIVYPQFGITTTIEVDALIAAIFTAASLARSYLLRRVFEFFTCRHPTRQAIDNAGT